MAGAPWLCVALLARAASAECDAASRLPVVRHALAFRPLRFRLEFVADSDGADSRRCNACATGRGGCVPGVGKAIRTLRLRAILKPPHLPVQPAGDRCPLSGILAGPVKSRVFTSK